jgi:hypothetical protein
MIAGYANNSETASNFPAEVKIFNIFGRTVIVFSPDYLNKMFLSSPVGMIITYSMES